MNQNNRRRVLLLGLVGCSSFVSGCIWNDATGDVQAPAASPGPAPTPSPSPPPAPPPSAENWSVTPTPYFLTGTGSVFDLSATLPTGTRKGGTFAVSPNGTPLPVGMALMASGLLSVGSAVAGRADGVIFTYAEPAG